MADLIFNSAIHGDIGVIPYPIRNGATEALEFYTDVLPSYTNEAEERRQLRALPRQYLKYTNDASFGNMQEIYNAVRANLRGNWLVPSWFEAQPVVVSVGQQTINADTLLHDLRENSHALIFKSICDWQIVQIAEIETDSVTLVEECAFQGRAYLVPLRVGKISSSASAAPTGFVNSFEFQYYIEDVLAGLTESPTQHNGKDLYTIPYLIDGAGSVKIIQDESQLEFAVGGIASDTFWNRSQSSKEYKFDGQGAADYRNFKNWFYRRAGRFRDFYSPSFESNLQNRSTGTVVSTFKFKDEGYVNNLFAHVKRIGFRLSNGSWQIRTVTAAENIGNGESQLTLNAPLNVPANSIQVVSFVSLNRLDTDRVEISLGQNGYFKSSASVMELSE